MFFAISGLLITWLMLLENGRNGRVNLRNFYARRALRILPVYITFLCVLAALQIATPFGQSPSAWLGNLTFTTDFLQDRPWTSGHLWSLAVEEQFYILWPSLFVLCGVGRDMRMSAWILMPPILIAPVVRVVSYLELSPVIFRPWLSDFSFLNNVDSLAIGCACGIILARRPDAVKLWIATWPRFIPCVALLMIAIPYILSRLFLLGVLTVPFGYSLQISGIAILMMQSLLYPEFGIYKLLNHPLICRVGLLSYSVYIWQQIFCTEPRMFGLEKAWWLSFPTWLIPVFFVAMASYYCLEQPLLRLRVHFR